MSIYNNGGSQKAKKEEKEQTRYVIVSDDDTSDKDQLYWNADKGWGDYDNATMYDREIFTVTLPLGVMGIYEITIDKAELLRFYKVTPLIYANIN